MWVGTGGILNDQRGLDTQRLRLGRVLRCVPPGFLAHVLLDTTLSQPGQTGTVVWDSSILMAKFLLSIKSLHTRYYLTMEEGKKGNVVAKEGNAKKGETVPLS